MKVLNKTICAIAVAGALGTPLSANAIIGVLFDQTGGGGAGSVITGFSQEQGNAVLDNGLAAPQDVASTTTALAVAAPTLYGQSIISGFTGLSGFNTTARKFTYQFMLPVSSAQGTVKIGGVPTATVDKLVLSDDVTRTGYFRIYVDNDLGAGAPDGSAGTGFGLDTRFSGAGNVVSTVDGALSTGQTLIAEGNARLTNNTPLSMGQDCDIVSLLGASTNGGIAATCSISASLSIDSEVSFQDSNYFTSSLVAIGVDITVGTLGLLAPFSSTVSLATVGITPFFGDTQSNVLTSTPGTIGSTHDLPLNDFECFKAGGLGGTTSPCDLQVQSSGNGLFNAEITPEPGSVALLGLGLGMLGFGSWRKRRKA